MTPLNYKRVKPAVLASLFLGLVLLLLSFGLGKNEFFLSLNGDGGFLADAFFKFITHLGHGIMWTAWLLYVVVTKRYRLLPLLISAVLFLTVVTQICKHVILPDQPRPLTGIPDQTQIHYVRGVEVHSINSFPSGHTALAFTYAFFITLISKRKHWIYLSFIAAMLIGYSRIYLGQHFPLDVGAGIIEACVCCYLFVSVQKWYDNRWPAG